MPWTDEFFREENMIMMWAQKHCNPDTLMAHRNGNQDTYFLPMEDGQDIMDFGFVNVPELKQALERWWQDDESMQEMILPCAVAAFKAREKAKSDIATEKNDEAKNITLPDFVYEF